MFRKPLLLTSLILAATPFATFFTVQTAHAAEGLINAKTYSLVNKKSGKCMRIKIDNVLSAFEEQAYEGTQATCDTASDATKTQRFYLVDVDDKSFYTGGTPSGWYTIHPVSHLHGSTTSNQYNKCLDHLWGSDFRWQQCNDSGNQRFLIESYNGGFRIKADTSDALTKCMSNLIGSDAVSGLMCTPLFTADKDRLTWYLSEKDSSHYAPTHAGIGGDAAQVAFLDNNGIDVAAISNYSLSDIRNALSSHPTANNVVVLRGRVKNNLFDAPQSGFRICAHPKPYVENSTLMGVNGSRLACAYTDIDGSFTLVGVPKNSEITLTESKEGFLQLAYTTKTSIDNEGEYQGTATDFFGGFTYLMDPRYNYSEGYRSNGNLGGMAFTIVHEHRDSSHPKYGWVDKDTYFHEDSPNTVPGTFSVPPNGVEGVTFSIWRDLDGNGVFTDAYKDTEYNNLNGSQTSADGIADGMFYTASLGETLEHDSAGLLAPLLALISTDPSISPMIYGKEFPANWLTATQYFGLAMVTHMPEGTYEVEAHHPTLNCRASTDAWSAGNSQRVRFQTIKSRIGDVRWYCTAP